MSNPAAPTNVDHIDDLPWQEGPQDIIAFVKANGRTAMTAAHSPHGFSFAVVEGDRVVAAEVGTCRSPGQAMVKAGVALLTRDAA